MASEKTASLKVTGWNCEGCTSHTEASLKKVPGVSAVKTDLKAGIATITFDEARATVADLEKAIAAAGYKVAK